MGLVGGVQDAGAPGPDSCRLAVVNVAGGVQAEAAVAVLVVVPREEFLAVRPGGFGRGERAGNAGRYFNVVNGASEYGLSLDTWGRKRDWVTPRSASISAAGLEIMELPRSACKLSWPRVMPCLAQVAAMSSSARTADSRVATIQPTA